MVLSIGTLDGPFSIASKPICNEILSAAFFSKSDHLKDLRNFAPLRSQSFANFGNIFVKMLTIVPPMSHIPDIAGGRCTLSKSKHIL